MRAVAIAIGLTLGASLAGCESAEQKCDVARNQAAETLRPTMDEAVAAQRQAEQARTNAMSDAARCAMDLGNLRSDAVNTALPGTEAAIGVEVAVGAMIAAMLAVDELAPDDPTGATAVSGVVTEELGGRYGTLMDGPTDARGAGETLATAGDESSTRLQLVVRELPERVRARVLDRFATMQTREAAPAAGTTLAQLREKWQAYEAARAAVGEARTHATALVEAVEALQASREAARAALSTLPDSVRGSVETACPGS